MIYQESTDIKSGRVIRKQVYNYDWIYRILKANIKKVSEENAINSKEPKKRVFRTKLLREKITPSAGLEPATARLTAECSTN